MTDEQPKRAVRKPLSLDDKMHAMRDPKVAAIEKTAKTVEAKRRELAHAEQKLAQAQRDLVRVDKMIAAGQLDEPLDNAAQ